MQNAQAFPPQGLGGTCRIPTALNYRAGEEGAGRASLAVSGSCFRGLRLTWPAALCASTS